MTTNATELANWLRNVAAASYDTRCAEAADLLTQQAERIEALEGKCALLAASEARAEAECDALEKTVADCRDAVFNANDNYGSAYLGGAVGDPGDVPHYLRAVATELRADRDSWRDQASQRVVDWDEMRLERDALKARVDFICARAELRQYNMGYYWHIKTVDVPMCMPIQDATLANVIDAAIATQGGKEGT